MIAKDLFFVIIFIYYFQFETERILKMFHFWGSYRFPLDLMLHLVKTSMTQPNRLIMFFPKLFRPTVRKNCFLWSRKPLKFEAEDRFFEIIGTIYSNSEKSEQFLKQNSFLTCSWGVLRSNTLKQFKFKLGKNGIQRPTGKPRKCDLFILNIWI